MSEVSHSEQGDGEGTFGVYTEVRQALTEGPRSIILYTARGDSMFGRSLSAYWSLTQQEAIALGLRLIEEAARARGHDEAEDHRLDRSYRS